MKDYAALIPTATAEDVLWLVMEAAGDAELRFYQFEEIVRAAERRLSDLEDDQVLPSGDHPAVSDSAGSVRAKSDMKKRKGWPDCVKCELYTFTGECSEMDESGLSPCEVMSRKMYKVSEEGRLMLEQAYRLCCHEYGWTYSTKGFLCFCALWGLRSKWKGGEKLEIPDYHSEGSD